MLFFVCVCRGANHESIRNGILLHEVMVESLAVTLVELVITNFLSKNNAKNNCNIVYQTAKYLNPNIHGKLLLSAFYIFEDYLKTII